jgi:hypothetical protein
MLEHNDPHLSKPLAFYPVAPELSQERAASAFGRRKPDASHTVTLARGENASYYGIAPINGVESAFRRDRNGVVSVISSDVGEDDGVSILQEAHRAVAMSGNEPVSMRWPLPTPDGGRVWRLSPHRIPVTVSRTFGTLSVTPLARNGVGFRVDGADMPAFLKGEFVPAEMQGENMRYFSTTLRADLLAEMRDIPGLLSPVESFDARLSIALLRMARNVPEGASQSYDSVKTVMRRLGDRFRPVVSGAAELSPDDAVDTVADLRVIMAGDARKIFGADGESYVNEIITPIVQDSVTRRLEREEGPAPSHSTF